MKTKVYIYFFTLLIFSQVIDAKGLVPSSAYPGRLEHRMDKPKIPKSVLRQPVKTIKPIAQAEEVGKILLTLQSVSIEGGTVYEETELLPLYAELLGKEKTLSDVLLIADKITNFYRNDGYILAQAIIPADQELDPSAANLKVTVLEGYIDRVVYEDVAYETGEKGTLINDYLKQIPTSCKNEKTTYKKGERCPIHRDILERYLLLAQDLPGVNVETVLMPGDSAASANLYVTITEKLIGAYVAVDNRGTQFAGPTQVRVGAKINSLFNVYTQSDFEFLGAENGGVLLGKFNESIPIFDDGLLFNLSAVYSAGSLGGELEPLEIESSNLTVYSGIDYPIIRSRAVNLNFYTGFTYRNQSSDSLGVAVTRDKLAVFNFGLSYDVADGLAGGGVSLVDFKLKQGTGWFEDKPVGHELASVENGTPNFTTFNLHLSRLQKIYDDVFLLIEGSGQFAFNSLLVSEQFGYGGEQYGRGYDPSELLGDHGLAAKVELQYSPDLPISYPKNLQLYTFYDVGRVWYKSPLCGCIQALPTESASSAGTGFRINAFDWLSGNAEFAFPLDHIVSAEGNSDWRFFFRIAARY